MGESDSVLMCGVEGMTRPYSDDLRLRVVCAVAAGGSCRVVGKRFSIGVSTVVRWAQRLRATGSVAPKPMGGARQALVRERDWLLARIAEKPDVTLRALVAELEARGVKASYGAVWRFCAREGLTFKKRPSAPVSRRGRTSPAVDGAGRRTRAGSTPRVSSSSTRPGPRPT